MLTSHDETLLMALRRGRHFKAHPGDVALLLGVAIGEIDAKEAQSSGRRLCAQGLAAFVRDGDAPGKILLRITDSGIALADNLIEEARPKSFRERIGDISRSDWIALGAFITSIVALFR